MGEFDQHEGEAQTILNLAEAAMHMYRAAIDSLPFPEDKKFQKRAEVVLYRYAETARSTDRSGKPQQAHTHCHDGAQ